MKKYLLLTLLIFLCPLYGEVYKLGQVEFSIPEYSQWKDTHSDPRTPKESLLFRHDETDIGILVRLGSSWQVTLENKFAWEKFEEGLNAKGLKLLRKSKANLDSYDGVEVLIFDPMRKAYTRAIYIEILEVAHRVHVFHSTKEMIYSETADQFLEIFLGSASFSNDKEIEQGDGSDVDR